MRLFLFSIGVLVGGFIQAQKYYYPERGIEWETKLPTEFKIDTDQINKAVMYAKSIEYSEPKDIRLAIYKAFKREPFHEIKGPTRERGKPAGMILKNGYVIASWGDTKRVDMTFSVTKSYLSTIAGLAWDQKLILSIDDPVHKYVWDDTFRSDHNSKVTWKHLLTQSSDWSGQLWDGYDWADRPPREGGIDEWKNRKLLPPGTNFEYNDVRVNVLAYSLLNVWRKPLPQVLKEEIMDPIGASTTWRWYGYEDSWVSIDGVQMQSVSGGGHSGGGLFINTEDHARFGLLFLSKGKWENEQLISEKWIQMATQSSFANENYGFMWWLNPNSTNSRMDSVSKNGYYAAGFGGNFIIVEPDENLVIVSRWMEPSKAKEFVKMVKEAL